ncbi:MAG: hypothetical protein ABSG96_27140, partial [Terracidiphilus sp.]
LKRRLGDATRSEFGKLTSVQLFERLLSDGAFESPKMPEAAVRIDTSTCTPMEAADQIMLALGLAC